MRNIKIAMIAAMASNHVIGNNNQIPWRYPKDFAYFKRITLGKPIIMGRLTFLSLGKPLPGRLNIVMTTSKDFHHDGVVVCHSLDEALAAAVKYQWTDVDATVNEIMIIGGGNIYRQALPIADIIYLTEIQHDYPGDAYFPELNSSEWREVSRDCQPADSAHEYPYDYVRYERKK